eukprot:3880823-Prymnesium_polylepis.1
MFCALPKRRPSQTALPTRRPSLARAHTTLTDACVLRPGQWQRACSPALASSCSAGPRCAPSTSTRTCSPSRARVP